MVKIKSREAMNQISRRMYFKKIPSIPCGKRRVCAPPGRGQSAAPVRPHIMRDENQPLFVPVPVICSMAGAGSVCTDSSGAGVCVATGADAAFCCSRSA